MAINPTGSFVLIVNRDDFNTYVHLTRFGGGITGAALYTEGFKWLKALFGNTGIVWLLLVRV